MILTQKKLKGNARKQVHVTPIRLPLANLKSRIQAHSHYSVRRSS